MTKHLLLGAAVLALATSGALAREMKFAPGEDARFHWDSFDAFKAGHDLTGQKLVIDGPWGGVDKALFETVLAAFEAATGASVDYNGGDGFEQRIMVNVEAGSPPDIAVVPQPGLAADLARRGWPRITPPGNLGSIWAAMPGPMARRRFMGSFTRST